jgi:hypothetical protein
MTNNQTSLPSFTLLAKYNEETQQQLAKQQRYADRVKETEQQITALDYRKKQAITKAVVEGTDTSEEVAQINKDREAAVKELEDRQQELNIVRSVQKRQITLDNLKTGLRAFQEQYQAEQINPEIEKLEALKIAYIKQLIDIQRREKHFENEARNAMYTINPKAIGLAYGVGFKNKQQRETACVTTFEVESLQRGQIPSSVREELK